MGSRKSEIIQVIQSFSGEYSTYKVFTDWVTMIAISIQNGCDAKCDEIREKREQLYRNIISKYRREEQKKFTVMFGMLIAAFEEEISDILGEIYMKAECGSKKTGQFFTPFHLSCLSAELSISRIEKR